MNRGLLADVRGLQVSRPVDTNCGVRMSEETFTSSTLWYHGNLDRLTAESRLMASSISGSFLIRESDRGRNSYVLSYLGVTGINHFRITAVCGEYYIGGRKFPSLSSLVAFYSNISDLLFGERLCYPVNPPEPVVDCRRVVALFPYTKLAESDELSFLKGDILTVQNDLSHFAEGWLWCKNLRTFESGLVFKDLITDVSEDIDVNEMYPWYHSNISKEEAVEQLAKMGPGSFLVRKSERSPGNYSLFFHIKNTVQRFRIEKIGCHYFMAGHSFDSLEEVISHYQSSEIVEGHCLGDAVLKAPVQMTINQGDQDDDVYATLRESRDLEFSSSTKKQETSHRGHLFKKSKKTSKWKNYFFVLDPKEQSLCYFEHERRVKPKGLIDLTSTSLYPLHESLFDRGHCFQLVERAIPCLSTYYYLSADSPGTLQSWISAVKPVCGPQQLRTKNGAGVEFTQMRTLSLTIFEGKRIPAKLAPHPFATISLNNIKVGKTSVKNPPDPNWEEEFLIEQVPFDVNICNITINTNKKKNETSSKSSCEVAYCDLDLDSIISGDEVEKWIPLNGSQTPLREDYGLIRIKIKFLQETILPLRDYSSFKELISSGDLEVVCVLEQLCLRDRLPLAAALLSIFKYERKETTLIRSMIEREVKRENDPSCLFMNNNLTVAIVDCYMKSTCNSYLESTLKNPIKKILESKQSCELNPSKLESLQEACSNAEHLLAQLDSIVDSVFHSVESCPNSVRFICGCLQRAVNTKWPSDNMIKTRIVSNFIFLKLICPAINNPKQCGLTNDQPSDLAARSLVMISKCLEHLAHLTEFGNFKSQSIETPAIAMTFPREPWMEIVNPFILKNKARIIKFLDDLAMVNDPPEAEDSARIDPSRDLATIHGICESHFQEILNLSQSRPMVKRLALATDFLTKQRARHLENIIS